MSLACRSSSLRTLTRVQVRRHASTYAQSESSFARNVKAVAYSTTFAVGLTLFAVYYADSRSAIHRYVVPPLSRVLLDAEKAHKAALGVLKSGLGPSDQIPDDELLRVELWDKVLSNPVGLAAGFDKDGEAVNGLFDLGFAWVEIGSITPKPQPGNPQPRVFHLPEDQAVINRYGFPSKGATLVLSRLQARYATRNAAENHPNGSLLDNKILSINLGKNKSSAPDSLSDFLLGVQTFGPLADVLVVNVSSPNTPGLRGLQSRGMLIELLDAVKRERDSLHMDRALPKLLVKIAPDLSEEELTDVAEAVRETGIDGVIVSNTTIQRPEGVKSANKKEAGGLSGVPLKPLTLRALKTLRPLLPASIPIVGCGGIATGADALEYARAGATTVQLYTSFAYGGAGTPRRIKDEIVDELRRSNQSWMDAVREGQKAAWKEPQEAHGLVTIVAPEVTSAIKEGSGAFTAMGEQLINILKTDSHSVEDKVQQPESVVQ
ncbi:Dihydroorotate dehydrogenase (quinone), mitochondrial Short=DHOdehase; AltName: Full=Dihydroorotate oxidase; Flags: Precursor [Serendipita indica DSM 11827]|uniref:Dihydroorotate dehydrogenase (quinone), mitochondrial n=1 Tax=Serendipita indica (strain DSM 11827) TaxID=1109443 RepID=G4TDF3_SERID|nr:Dihydroorotate dehydrogenase (quinone), mitochondrial Short=DHOdehase; AltName: Full=Dihydroorotate oxidase; Flags: Precursor [Serendipita indica DSM 11827]CCA69346.1 related to dihydroorotate dehydrogenase, mitochondrial precursor [Serendipita indica DSM 11827]